jgi:N6-adenosine-specific RNA methylase IME4/ParB-like chromosome segregation protein Spo0J
LEVNANMKYQVMPALGIEDYEALKSDIARRGVLIPVEYDERGNVLDGHHRLQACKELGLTEWPKFIRKGLSEEEKRQHARQLNLARRHLNQEQKRHLIQGQLKDTPQRSNRQIASGLGVDHKTVSAARKDLEGTGEIPQLNKTIGTDGKARPAKPIRTAFIDDSNHGRQELFRRAKEIRAQQSDVRQTERIKKIEQISRGNKAFPAGRLYPVIYADPPWRYENPPMGYSTRSIENHYPTMTFEEICALPLSEIAHGDSILYLWATAPALAECMDVIKAWGFQYRTCFVWVKDKIGMGWHARNQHELLLVAKRGNIPPPPAESRVGSVIHAPRAEHSAKPAKFYELIERMYPDLAKIELFCRSPRKGWAAWGNQDIDTSSR